MNGKSTSRVYLLITNILPACFQPRLSREMNKNLPSELNFEIEAQNAEKCRQILKHSIEKGDLIVPYVRRATKRVIQMSFEEGKYITDPNSIDKVGLKKADVARIISTAFCEQMYRGGFVHCDPHEANLLVRPNPQRKNQAQVVLLDHGLYRELGDEFRMHYSRLWRGIVNSNEQEIRRECEFLNAGKMYTLLTAMLTMRPWDDVVANDIDRLNQTGTAGDGEMLKAYAKKYFSEIVVLLGRLPSNLLLLMKTNDCLRHLDRTLDVPINSVIVVAKTVAEVILQDDLEKAKYSPRKIVIAFFEYVNVMLKVATLSIFSLFM